MNTYFKVLIIIICTLIIIYLSVKINKEQFIIKLSPVQIFANLIGFPVNIIENFGLGFFKKHKSKLLKIGLSVLTKLDSKLIKLFKEIINLPHIVEVLPTSIEKSKGNPLDFMRYIEIESLKIMVNCGTSNDCRKKVTQVYVDVVKFMLFRSIPKNDNIKFLIDINKIVVDMLPLKTLNLGGDVPSFGSTPNNEGVFTMSVNTTLKNRFANILFKSSFLENNFNLPSITNSSNCKVELKESRIEFNSLYFIIFNPFIVKAFSNIFKIIDFPSKYKMIWETSSGVKKFSFKNIPKGKFEIEINGCDPRNPNWVRDKTTIKCLTKLEPIKKIKDLKSYFNTYFFYYTNQFLNSIYDSSNVYDYTKLNDMLVEALFKDLALNENTDDKEDSFLGLVNYILGRRDKILCEYTNSCCS